MVPPPPPMLPGATPAQRPTAPVPPPIPPPAPPAPVSAPPPVLPAQPARGPVIPTAQPKATQQPYSSELRTMAGDIANITTGRPPQGVQGQVTKPFVPTAPTSPAPMSAPPAAMPPPARSSNLRPIIIIGGLLGIIGIGAIWLLSGGSEGDIVLSPTPRVTTTPSPTPTPIRTLREYFKDTIQETGPAVTHLASVGITLPLALQSVLGTDWGLLSYAQTEQLSTPVVASRSILVFEIRDASATNQAMQEWEGSGIVTALSGILGYDPTKASATTFLTATYRGLPVRYRNFALADHTIDYSIVLATNGKGYLIIAGSREAAFFAMDTLLQ